MPPRRQQQVEEIIKDPVLECYKSAKSVEDEKELSEIVKSFYDDMKDPDIFVSQQIRLEAFVSFFKRCVENGLSLEDVKYLYPIFIQILDNPESVESDDIVNGILEYTIESHAKMGIDKIDSNSIVALTKTLEPYYTRRNFWRAMKDCDEEEERWCKGEGTRITLHPPVIPVIPQPLSTATLEREKTELELLVEERVKEIRSRKHIF